MRPMLVVLTACVIGCGEPAPPRGGDSGPAIARDSITDSTAAADTGSAADTAVATAQPPADPSCLASRFGLPCSDP